ncbi:MAG: hypothetical protein WA673_07895, partial [Candidatus Acidiferrales bacterium]
LAMPVADAFCVQLLTNHASQMPASAAFGKPCVLRTLPARQWTSKSLETVMFLCNLGERLPVLAWAAVVGKRRASNFRERSSAAHLSIKSYNSRRKPAPLPVHLLRGQTSQVKTF